MFGFSFYCKLLQQNSIFPVNFCFVMENPPIPWTVVEIWWSQYGFFLAQHRRCSCTSSELRYSIGAFRLRELQILAFVDIGIGSVIMWQIWGWQKVDIKASWASDWTGLWNPQATYICGQKFRQFRTHLHHILVSTVQICKPMIQNNVEKFRPIHGLSFTQQSNFDMLNNFLRNQLKKAASVPDFSSTSEKNGLFEKILLQN